MKRIWPFFIFCILLSSVSFSQTQLGEIQFAATGKAEAQPSFLRGVLLLHSFEYGDAREAFEEAMRIDPDFVMAYWGAALTHTHPLWMEQDVEAARAILKRLGDTPEQRQSKAQTDREKTWLSTVEVLYGDGTKEERDFLYEKAMGELSQRFPKDVEASAFHALSILGTSHQGRDFRIYMRAAGILEEAYEQAPDHPGILHYMIHCYDDPVHASLGLRPARKYAKIAPAASHAQHMPSHIFLALGMWYDVVASNTVAWDVADERVQRKKLNLDERGYHYLYWLQYGYLQQGRYSDAQKMLDIMEADTEKSGSKRTIWHLARMRAAQVLQTQNWKNPAASLPIDLEKAGDTAGAIHQFTKGYAAAMQDDLQGARQQLDALKQRNKSGTEEKHAGHHAAPGAQSYNLDQKTIEILTSELEATILFAEGKKEEAVKILEQATSAETQLTFEFGPPDIVKPSHELLGEMLLKLSKPAEAQKYFEIALQRAPRRTLSLQGLAVAAERSGNKSLATKAQNELREILKNADESVKKVAGLE